MFRLRYTLVLMIVGFATSAIASDEKKGEHGQDAHKPPIYEVVGENEHGQTVKVRFDLGDAAQAAKFREFVEHGHVHEIVNVSPPGVDKLASLRADLGLWTLAIFLVLFYVLHKFAWPKAVSGLNRREEYYRGALADAEKARDEARALMAENEKQRFAMGQQVKAIIDEAKRDAQMTADDLLTKARADITNERERLHREIQIEVDQAMQSLWTKTASLATQVAGKAIRKQFDGDQKRRLIDEALDDIRKATA